MSQQDSTIAREGMLAACFALCLGTATVAAAPAYDHVVIAIEENRSPNEILGSANAPFINSLARQGLSLTDFHALYHGSQANYFEFFSGSTQGVLDETVPNSPFTTPNLGAELIASGKTFAGYSEDLPAVGSTVVSSGQYVRRHNPWSDWQNDPPGANQLLPATNQPFTAFPADFSQLPALSFVVPNLDNDMHDGSVAQGDAWLKAKLGDYAAWAQTHNSLLIVTFDEDSGTAGNNNKIATVVVGPNVAHGQNNATWTLHNLLRTFEDVAGTSHAGAGAMVQPINGMFAADPAAAKKTFQRGASSYTGAIDTHLRQDDPASSFGTVTSLVVDLDDNAATGNQPVQALIRFDSLFGAGPNQIPAGDSILSAKLVIATTSTAGDESTNTIELHRMKTAWSESSTWNSVGGGVSADDVEAVAAAEFNVIPKATSNTVIFDVTSSLQAWQAGAANNGWVLMPTGPNGWRWYSSDFATTGLRPYLEVTYAYPAAWKVDADGNWSAAGNWNPGVPNAVEATATFGAAATARRTVTLDAPAVVGKLVFDNANGYTIAGPSTLTLQGGIGNASIYVAQGSHTIAAPLALAGDLNTTIAAGALEIMGDIAGNDHTINNDGAGTLIIAGHADVGSIDGLGNLAVAGTLTADHIRQNTLLISGALTINASDANGVALITSGSEAASAAMHGDATVPEPSGWALLLLGAAILPAVRRRCRDRPSGFWVITT